MTMLLDRTEVATPSDDAPKIAPSPPAPSELKVTIEKHASHGFLLDPSGDGAPSGPFPGGRQNLGRYFDWLQVPSKGALRLVDRLVQCRPETTPRLPFGFLVSPRWTAGGRSIEVFVNMSFRPYNELLVRAPSWSEALVGHQPIERWVGLQPYLARPGRIGFVGLSVSSDARRSLGVYVRVDDLDSGELTRLATLAGAPAARLAHLWQTLSGNRSVDPGTALLSVRLSGREALDIGVTFPAVEAGDPSDIKRRIELLSRVHDLDASTYFDALGELKRRYGKEPRHTSLGLSSDNGQVAIKVSLELGTPPCSRGARHFDRLSLCRALSNKQSYAASA